MTGYIFLDLLSSQLNMRLVFFKEYIMYIKKLINKNPQRLHTYTYSKSITPQEWPQHLTAQYLIQRNA